jgi:CRISPR-associated protein Csb1
MPDEETNLVDEFFKHDRVIIEAALELTSGSFFQPTGFPDIGACIFVDKDGRRRCLVESEQSMANRLEAVCTQAPGTWSVPFAGKLPIIEVADGSGNLLGTNLTEPHRISSSYILEGTLNGGNDKLQEIVRKKLGISDDGKRWPLDKRGELSGVVFALDPAAILHGFQFMQWSAVGLRQQRLLHARMEAVLAGDSDVHYGAVKVDAIDPDGHREKSNVGQSIAYKARLIPESITATFEIDVLGLRARRLVSNGGESATGDANVAAQKFLLALALWKIRQFLADQSAFDPRTGQTDRALRLRSDCALKLRYMKTKEDQGKTWTLRYRTQSNGAQFDEPVALTLANLVKVSDDSAQPLAAVPDFKPFLKDVIGKDGLEIRVTYTAPPAKPKGATPKESTETESDVENEDDPGE